MSNAWFFEKFELIADLPDAVSRMRALVLELAVQGRLVEQDSNDATVLVLLQDLKKASAAETLKAVDSEQLQTKRPFEIPETWAWASLHSLGTISGGHTPSTNIQSYWNGSINWFTSKDIKQLELYDSELKITEDAIKRTGLKLYPSGSVVVVGRSGILKRTLPVAIIRNPSTVNQDLKVIQPTFAGMEKYIQVMLRGMTSYILKKLVKTGTTVQSLKYDEFFDFPFPLPPLSEQHRIVAKVEELMGICDRLELEQRERESSQRVLVRSSLQRFSEEASVENLGYLFHGSYTVSPSDLRKTILTLAVQGKLVPQDPKENQLDKSKLRLNVVSRHNYVDDEETSMSSINDLNYEIPADWRWTKLDDILVYGPTNGISPQSVDFETGVKSLTLTATTSGRFKSKFFKFLTIQVPLDSELWLKDGDILVQRGNTHEYVGVSAIYRGPSNTFVYPDLMMKLRVVPDVDVSFIHIAMSEECSRSYLRRRASGTTGSMPKISQKTLRSLPIPLPPLAEQRRIVATVEELMSMVDELEEMEKQATARGSSLLDAIVHELAAIAG